MTVILQSFTRLLPEREQPLTSITIKTSQKHVFRGHQGIVWSFVFLQDNVHIVSGSEDGTMCKWDCEKGRRVGKPWKVDSPVIALALSPDGKTIACGRGDGRVQRCDTNGRMMEGIWTGHSRWVRGLSWSPGGHHLTSGSNDGTIIIRNAASGRVEVGPINANQGWVRSVVYSPSGDRIASGGDNISIWNSHTGELCVGPIQVDVSSIVWSLDGSKLYSAGWFARVFDSASGAQLHRFQYDDYVISIALSPKHDHLLAGVGERGIAQLWDTESYQPLELGQPFYPGDNEHLEWVSFSPDGRYLAYSGYNGKVTLRLIKDSSLQFPISVSSTNLQNGIPQEHTPTSLSLSHPNIRVDAANPLAQSAVNNSEGCDDPYNNPFFMPSFPSSPLPRHTRMRRLRNALSYPHEQTNESRYLKRGFIPRRALSNYHLHALTRTKNTRSTSKGKYRAGHHHGKCNNINRFDAGTAKRDNDKRDQCEEFIADMQTPTPGDLSSPTELDSNANHALWKLMIHFRQKKAPAEVVIQEPSPQVEVYAKRVPQGHGVLDSKHIKKSARQAAHAGGPPQAGSSSQPFAGHAGQARPVTSANHISNDSDSDWRIEGSWNRFLDKICYPCGH